MKHLYRSIIFIIFGMLLISIRYNIKWHDQYIDQKDSIHDRDVIIKYLDDSLYNQKRFIERICIENVMMNNSLRDNEEKEGE